MASYPWSTAPGYDCETCNNRIGCNVRAYRLVRTCTKWHRLGQRKLCCGSAGGQRHHDRFVDEWNHDGEHGWVDDRGSGYWFDLHPESIR